MTGEQKQEIVLLREQGANLTEIAEKLGLPKNTVKTFCWRHHVTPAASTEQPRIPFGNFCLNCGKAIPYEAKKKPKKFCCDKCREAWWNHNRRTVHKEALCRSVCAHCGKEFEKFADSKQRYCCHACYISARFGEAKHHGNEPRAVSKRT